MLCGTLAGVEMGLHSRACRIAGGVTAAIEHLAQG